MQARVLGWSTGLVVLVLATGCAAGPRARNLPGSREVATRYNLARVYIEQGRVQESIELLERVLKEDPRHAEARNLLGLVYWSVGRQPEARAEFERALELNPYLSDARVNLGVVHSQEGDYAKAEEEFRRALADKTYLTPEKPLVNLAVNEMKQGRPRQALAESEQAIRRNPRYPRAYEVFVQALLKADPRAAGAEYRALLRDMDGSQDFHLHLAEAFLKENDRRRARAHLEKVVALNPSSEQAGRARRTLETLP